MELLKQLYTIHAPTGHEWPLICFIREYISKHLSEAEVKMDGWGNLYIKKGIGPFPTLACHLDQVQMTHSEDFNVKEENGTLYGWSDINQQRENMGADDKNGIWICLRCLEKCPCLKVFMAIGEEKGCIGSNRANMAFFNDSLYVLEVDCKGGKEVHTILKGIPCTSDDFVEALQLEANGYTLTDGKGSDILALTLNGIGVSCANIPAGYYLPHKDEEYTVISELEHALNFLRHIVITEQRRFPHTYMTYTQQMIKTL